MGVGVGIGIGGIGFGVKVVVTIAPVAVPSLFPGVGSGVLDLLLAVLLMLPELGAMKLMLRLMLAVLIKLTAGKVTIPVVVL